MGDPRWVDVKMGSAARTADERAERADPGGSSSADAPAKDEGRKDKRV